MKSPEPNTQLPDLVDLGASHVVFEVVPTFGTFDGMATITLAAKRTLVRGGELHSDFAVVAYLKATPAGLVQLREAIDKTLLMMAPAGGTG